MITITQRRERNITRQKIKLKSNIYRAIMRKQTKFILKIQNTNKHLFIRVHDIDTNVPICTVSTIKYKKDESLKQVRTSSLLKNVIEELVSILKQKEVFNKINKNSIIWYLGGGKYQGRIKIAIDLFTNYIVDVDKTSNSKSQKEKTKIKNKE